MSASRQAEWQRLLDFSTRMLQHARDGEWDTLGSMASERQAELEKFFATPVSPDDATTVEQGIHTISQIDAEITTLAASAHGVISQEQETLNKRQRASHAYTTSHHRD
jgi:hypothetical protein